MRKLFAHTKFVVTSAATVTVTAPAQLSAATTNPIFAAGTNAAQVTVTFAGHVIVGATSSRTRIVCVQLAVFPQASVATYVRVIKKLFGQPTLVVTSTDVTVTPAPQLSLVTTAAGEATGTRAAHATVILAGHVIVGGAVSCT